MAKVLHGDANGNQLNASENKTQIYGLKGNDTLISDGKSDVLLIGGSGNDTLIITGGNGSLSGGDGSDVFELNYSADKKLSAVIEDLDPSEDKIIVNFEGSTTPQLTSSVNGNDVVWQDSDGNFNVTLKSVRDNDYFDGTASNDSWDAWEAWKVLELVNQAREDDGKSPLTMSQGLMRGASIRAQEITSLGQDGALSNHTRPNGTNFSTVLNNKYSNPRENLDGGARTPNEVMYDWLVKSETHRKNILTSSFQKMGLGYVYNDKDVTNHRWYWAQMFADSLRSPETVSTARLSSVNFEINSGSKIITLTEGNNTIENSVYSATIQGTDSADSIDNTGLNVSISGGADNDTILSGGSFSTIAGNTGNDLISLGSDTKENVIEYSSGDGNDSVDGFHSTDTLKILDDEYTPAIVRGNVVVGVGSDSITLLGAADLSSVNIEGTRSKHYIFTNANDKINNTLDGATIEALGGKDLITNSGANVSLLGGTGSDSITNDSSGTGSTLDGGAGDDTLNNAAENVTVTGNAGNDFISNNGSQVSVNGGTGSDSIINDSLGTTSTVDGGAGDDTINNSAETVTVIGGTGSDNISNSGVEVSLLGGAGSDKITNDSLGTSSTLDGGTGDDTINNAAETVTVIGGTGSDNISNSGAEVSVFGGDGDDLITNYSSGTDSTLDGGTGDDTFENYADNVSINGNKGNDFIYNEGSNLTIDSGTNDDTISNGGYSNVVEFYSVSGGEAFFDRFGNLVTAEGGEHLLITGGTGNDSVNNSGSNVTIISGAGDDTIESWSNNESSINAGAGNDLINHYAGSSLTIEGGTGDDTIYSLFGSNLTITGAKGSDLISLSSWSENNLIVYNSGDGFDIIDGFNETDTLSIAGGQYVRSTLDNDIIFVVGEGRIKLVNAVNLGESLNIIGTGIESTAQIESGITEITESNINYQNDLDGATIKVSGYNDTITNSGANVSIGGSYNKDTINNSGTDVTINAGTGDDSINFAESSRNNFIEYSSGDGFDTISGFKEDDLLEIYGAYNYSTQTSNNDIIANVDSQSITLEDAATLDSANIVVWLSSKNSSIDGSKGKYINNRDDSVKIDSGAGDDTIETSGNNVTIDSGAGNDSIEGWWSDYNSMVGGAGNDTIDNIDNDSVTISGGEDNDSIHSSGGGTVIDGGTGDDTLQNENFRIRWGRNIRLYGNIMVARDISINGRSINDILANGYSEIEYVSAYVSMSGGEGNDSIDNSSSYVATIEGGAGNDTIYNYDGDSSSLLGGEDNDVIINDFSWYVSIDGGEGNNSIDNSRSVDVSITSGTGNDTISNSGANVSIDAGAGKNFIYNVAKGDTATSIISDTNETVEVIFGNDVTILGGENEDYISNDGGENISIIGGAGKDSIKNSGGGNVSILSGDGNDLIDNIESDSVTILSGAGNDSLSNWNSSEISILSGVGNDYIDNSSSNSVTIDTGDGNDSISNWNSSEVSILSGAGDDSITNNSDNVTIIAGTGNDLISLSSGVENNLIQYNVGDGNDSIWGLDENSSLRIGDGNDSYSTVVSGDDIIINVGEGSITLKDAREKPDHIILGESASSGGTSGDGGGGSSASGDGSSSGNGGSGGNSGRGGSSSGSSNAGASTDISNGINASGSTGTSSGNSSGSPTASEGSDSSSIDISNFSFSGNGRVSHSEETPAATFPTATPATTNSAGQYVYSGGNQVISNYQSWQKIIFNEIYTESLYDGADNLLIGSSTGALAIENAVDKIVDVSDASGKAIVKAYLSGEAGIVDGRGLEGYEIIHGSLGEDLIYAGDYGSQLWGNADNAVDSLVGGAGSDFFVGGMNQGADLFFNVSSADAINLNDATLENIVATYENEDKIAIAFDNGNIIGVQSSEALSGAFVLADGSIYRYNHINRTWQNE